MLVGLMSWFIWGLVLLLHVVHLEPLMQAVGAYRLEQPWLALIDLTPKTARLVRADKPDEEVALDAVKAGATLGEISDALRRVYGGHDPNA